MAGGQQKRGTGSKEAVSASSDTNDGDQGSVTTRDRKSKMKLDKSGLYDLQQVKRLLDDEVMAFMEDQGYVEATLVSNVKIIAGTLAVGAALYSHFGPGEFPANKPVVFACVAFYILCVGLINISSFIFEASAIFVGTLSTRAKQVNRGALAANIWVHTTIGSKGTSEFRTEIRTGPRKKAGSVSASHPYEKYITEEGRFLSDVFRADLKKTLSQLPGSSKKTN